MNSFLLIHGFHRMVVSAASLILLGQAAFGQDYNFVTLAGPLHGRGSEDGLGSDVRILQPYGIAVDNSNNVYVANSSRVRKITPAGVISTLAGAELWGSVDGQGSNARFYNPSGMAVDNEGNLYLADTGNDTIRRITPDGTVTTLAGLAHAEGSADGKGSNARFSYPTQVAVDSFGIVYVADVRNGINTIRQITPSGLVSTITELPGRPLAVNSQGDSYVTEPSRILKITVTGVVNTILTGNDRANFVSGAVDTLGNVYVADIGNYRIWKISPGATPVGTAELYGEVSTRGVVGPLEDRAGLAVDTTGNVYVTDTMVDSIRKLMPTGAVITLAGGVGYADGEANNALFRRPNGVAVNRAGDVFVADTYNHTIRRIAPNGTVSTFAGAPSVSGYADGTGSNARFFAPAGLAVDGADNVLVADTRNHVIRKITPTGVVSTLLGLAGTVGNTDGSAAQARFSYPNGVVVDDAQNIYVADSGNHTIRKRTSFAGVVSTLAGLPGSYGSADGTGTNARFASPSGLATDSDGNIYVADTGNSTIRKITAGGMVSTLAGLAGARGSADGNGKAARFSGPTGVTVDTTGNIYVADHNNRAIRKITPAGAVTTWAGNAGADGSANGFRTEARFGFPTGVALDREGNLYVADELNNNIRKGGVALTPPPTMMAPMIGSQPQSQTVMAGGAARFSVTASGSAPLAYQWRKNDADIPGATSSTYTIASTRTADAGSYTVVVSNAGGSATSSIATLVVTGDPSYIFTTLAGAAGISGSADGLGTARFNNPIGLAVDAAGNVYVGDRQNHTVRKITPNGTVTTLAGLKGSPGSADGSGSSARFNQPLGLALDVAGNVFVADSGNSTIRKITPGGVVSTFAGLAGSLGAVNGIGTTARFRSPYAVALDPSGDLYVADADNHSIRKITATGIVSTFAGTLGTSGSTDGVGSAARFNHPEGLTVDAAGSVFVADTWSHTIRKISPDGKVITLAGSPGSVGNANGTGGSARFYFPTGVAVDRTGMVLVADQFNHTLRQITSAGVVTAFAGAASQSGTANGAPNASRFSQPIAICLDSAGNIYVADYANHTIRKGALTSVASGPRLALQRSGETLQLTVSAPNGETVKLQSTTDLLLGPWIDVPSAVLSGTTSLDLSLAIPSWNAAVFYRAVVSQ